jgi:glutaredoxin 3
MSRVVLFSTSTCSWCRRAKRYFRERRIPFKEINIERDLDAARDIVRKTGTVGLPWVQVSYVQGRYGYRLQPEALSNLGQEHSERR